MISCYSNVPDNLRIIEGDGFPTIKVPGTVLKEDLAKPMSPSHSHLQWIPVAKGGSPTGFKLTWEDPAGSEGSSLLAPVTQHCHQLPSQHISLSSFTFIERPFNSSSLSAIMLVSSVYLRLLMFLPAILIPTCASSSVAFQMMYSAQKL